VPRYAGFSTFARLPRIGDVPTYDVAVVGIPFDSGVSYRPGARFGPAHVRQCSRVLRPYHPQMEVMPFATQQVVDAGDIACTPFDITKAMEQVEEQAYALIAGPVALVHFDAHLDTWDTYFDAPLTHGTPFRRAAEEGLFVSGHSAHVGIRGALYSPDDLSSDAELGFTVVHCREFQTRTVADVVAQLQQTIGDHPLYVSIDIDVLDPAHAPGTGTPEIGGLTSRELLEVVRGFDGLNLVGADIVEVAPAYDHAELTGIAAAFLAYEFLALLGRARSRT
jgi:agmatinase